MGRRLAPETLSRSFPGLLRGLLLLSLHEGLSVKGFPPLESQLQKVPR